VYIPALERIGRVSIRVNETEWIRHQDGDRLVSFPQVDNRPKRDEKANGKLTLELNYYL